MAWKKAFLGRADCVCTAAVGSGDTGSRADEETGDQRADVLPVEEEVCRSGSGGAATAEATGRREPQAEAAGGGPESGQANASGRAVKKRLKPARQRALVQRVQAAHCVSERRACEVLRVARSSHRYQSVRDERAALRIRLRDLAGSRIRYGYRRLGILLRREGWEVNHKLIYRLYVEEDLQLRRKSPKRRKSCAALSFAKFAVTSFARDLDSAARISCRSAETGDSLNPSDKSPQTGVWPLPFRDHFSAMTLFRGCYLYRAALAIATSSVFATFHGGRFTGVVKY